MTVPWWEKTVEYAFLLEVARAHPGSFAAPLAGKAERAGDAVFAEDQKLILVEFKRSLGECASEPEKYIQGGYTIANEQLASRDGHHFLIYGTRGTGAENSSALQLRAERYFSRGRCALVVDILDRGTALESFNAYLRILLAYKKSDDSDSGTGGRSPLITVLGVQPGDGALFCLSLTDYRKQFLERLANSVKPVPKRRGPSMG